MLPTHFKLLIPILLSLATAVQAEVSTTISKIEHMSSASLLLRGDNTKPIIEYRAETPRIPASTLKILTAWLAIQRWGLQYHFYTDFFLDHQNTLWIKGYGDPMLVSEEIQAIADGLQSKGLNALSGIRTDDSFFQDGLHVDGQSSSDNPYDAPVAALAANFNTLYLSKSSGELQSAESQTPLTTSARRIARNLKHGKQRISIGDAQLSARYFAEILAAKLLGNGVAVNGEIRSQKIPANLSLFYRHYSSRSLEDVLRAMLRYSTNFIANQLFLMLGAESAGAPANFAKGVAYARREIERQFHWRQFTLKEGAGLSRRNRISARQMVELLAEFYPYRALLPAAKPGILAKTGTLKGISCYAGYVEDLPFALFINQPAPYGLRKQVATALRQLTKSAPVR